MIQVPQRSVAQTVSALAAERVRHHHVAPACNSRRVETRPVHQCAVLMHLLDRGPWEAATAFIEIGADRQAGAGRHHVRAYVLRSAIAGPQTSEPLGASDQYGEKPSFPEPWREFVSTGNPLP